MNTKTEDSAEAAEQVVELSIHSERRELLVEPALAEPPQPAVRAERVVVVVEQPAVPQPQPAEPGLVEPLSQEP